MMRRQFWATTGIVATVVVGLSALHVWWLYRFRQGFAVDIDEAGYMWFAFHLHDAVREDGLVGLWNGIQGEGWVGPLLPALTALVQLVAGARAIVPSMAVQLVFFAVLVWSSFGIGRALLDRRAGLLTAVIVAALPAVTDFVRTYHLVLASTAMYALATFALLESDRLRRRGWVIVWGLALGLLSLSRSMTVAFLPALPLVACWILIIDRADRRRVANLTLGLIAFAVVALQWWASSWRYIADYLLNFGYGEKTPGGNVAPPPLSIDYWTDELAGLVDVALYLPLAVVLFASVLLSAAGWVAQSLERRDGFLVRGQLERAARSNVVVPLVVVLEGYVALTSSSNDGSGFVVPLLPALVALVVVALLRVPWRIPRLALAGALVAVSAFNVLMKADVTTEASEVRTFRAPILGWVNVTNGRGFFHQHLVNETGYVLGPPTRWLPDTERGWLTVYDDVVAALQTQRSPELRMYLTTTEPLLNVSAVRLASLRRGIRGGIFEPVATGGEDTVDAYRRFLADRRSNALVSVSAQGAHFGPTVTQERVESAASSLGFVRRARFALPDNRQLQVWVLPA